MCAHRAQGMPFVRIKLMNLEQQKVNENRTVKITMKLSLYASEQETATSSGTLYRLRAFRTRTRAQHECVCAANGNTKTSFRSHGSDGAPSIIAFTFVYLLR